MQSLIPQEFMEYARKLLGEERFLGFEKALGEVPATSVRLNPWKSGAAGLVPPDCSLYDGTVPWAESGLYLSSRPAFTFDPLLHAGAYYVQEAASMFLEQVVRRYVTESVVALDLCAAPGGKSTHLRSLLPEGSLLVSNEPVRARAQVLAENMTKWGHPDVVVTNSYPADFGALDGMFDVLVTDVPCSGEGMFRKEEDAVTGWSMDNVMMCRDRQRGILRDVWRALKPGGLLVYSTCTLNQYEDEENVAWIAGELGAEVLPLDVPDGWGVGGNLLGGSGIPCDMCGAENVPVSHFIQGEMRGEGFFLAVLRKTAGNDVGGRENVYVPEERRKGKPKKGSTPEPAVPAFCCNWLACSETFAFRVRGDELTAVHSAFAEVVERLYRQVKVMQAGVTVAKIKGRDWMPVHALALSTSLNRSVFPMVEVAYGQAVAYLRKETFTLPQDVEKGFVLLLFGGVPIGFVKNLGNRFNNLYPQEWRIRSGYTVPYCLNPSCL